MKARSFKRLIKALLLPFYHLINLFYFPLLKRYFFSKIEKVPRTHQLFFMTRFDFGTWLLLMHYAECWTKTRGPASLVLFIPNAHEVTRLARWICPNVEIIASTNSLSRLIYFLFRRDFPQFLTMNRIYAFACSNWPHALYLFDMTFCRRKQENISRYIAAFDPLWKNPPPFSKEFLSTYLRARQGYDYRRSAYQDMMKLFYSQVGQGRKKPSPESIRLLEVLGIDTEYVVMNINCKDYENKIRNNRRIHHPERYNTLIDHLISNGYQVIIQGRGEQPHFAARRGLIEYFSSSYATIENDHHLFSQSAFAIFPKTGPEVYGPICDIPVLGLNYTELANIVPKGRCRFFPKHVWDGNTKDFVHWKDLLKRPCFFDVGKFSYERNIEYIEMEEEEILAAGIEFLEFLPKPASEWLQPTSLQKEFQESLHPAHIDLFDVTELPCDAYLSSQKYDRGTKL